MILDSNIISYSAAPEHGALRQLIADNVPGVSAISYVEVLGFHNLKDAERAYLDRFFQTAQIVDIDRAVLDRAVTLRQQRRIKLGDSIVAATALAHDRVLVTRNVDDFKWIASLKLLNPFDVVTGPP